MTARYLLAIAFVGAICTPAHASGPVPLSFFGYTKTYHGQPNTEIPILAGSSRDWVVCQYSAGCGSAFVGGTGYPRGSNCDPAVQNAGWVAATTTEPTQGTFFYAALDFVINDDIAHGRDPMHVFFGMNPRWMTGLSGSGACAGIPTSIADLDLHVMSLATHLKGRVHRYEPWNEVNIAGFYAGTIAQLVTYSQHVHDLTLAIDPTAIITAPSITGWSGTGTPASATDYFKSFIDAGGAPTFTEGNIHSYPQYNSTFNCGQSKCPEQLFGQVEWYRNVLAYAGIPNALIDLTEFDSDAGGTTATDPTYIALTYLIGSSLGLNMVLEYTPDECVPATGTYGCLLGPTSGMNAAALAFRTIESEVAGSTWSTPIARVANTNRVTSTMTGGTPGTIGGCTPTGTLPSGMGAFNGECANGIILSYVGTVTIGGVLNNRFSLVGTDTVHASSANIYFSGSIVDGTTVQWSWWTQSQCIGLSPGLGSAANVVTNIQMADLTAGGAFLSSQGVFNMTLTTAPAATQCWHGLPSQLVTATTGAVRPALGFGFAQNVAVNEFIDIPAGPTYSTLDNGTTYQGDLTKADGSGERAVWDVSSYPGSNGSRVSYSAPAQYAFQRGVDGVEYPIIGNSIVLSNSPVFLRVAKQAGRF